MKDANGQDVPHDGHGLSSHGELWADIPMTMPVLNLESGPDGTYKAHWTIRETVVRVPLENGCIKTSGPV